MSDSPPVAVVTGAGRGAGRGIATALAAHGWQVYGTGRTIDDAPGWGVGVRLDHGDDDAVGALFERVERESGRLDLLVNNAASISDDLVGPKPFWQKPRDMAGVLDVGLRSAYIASWYAAPLLTTRERGLIVFTSSPGAVCYMHGPTCMPLSRRNTMPANVAEWLTAIDAHPDTIDTDLVVAVALSNGDASVEGIDPEDVTDSVEMLIGYGFLVDVVSMELDENREEHVLELRMPMSVQ